MLSSLAFASPMVRLGNVSKYSSAAASKSVARPRRSLRRQSTISISTSVSVSNPPPTRKKTPVVAALSSAERHAAALRETLEALRNEEKAHQMSGYMRHNFDFLGISAPVRRDAIRPHLERVRVASGLAPSLAIDVCNILWKSGSEYSQREYLYTGLDLLDYCKSAWVQVPAEIITQSFEYYISNMPWWDTIDPIATNLVRTAHDSHPKEIIALVEQWSTRDTGNQDADLWFRRCAILWQLKRRKNTDEAMLFKFILHNAQHDDTFVRKAIGWALREHRKTRAKQVDRFIEEHMDTLNALSVKEGWKHKEEAKLGK